MSNISEFVDKKKTDLILEDICLFLRIKEFFELFFLQHCEMYHFSTTWLISPKKLIGCSWTIYNRCILGPARPPLNYLSRPDSESVSPGGIRLGWGLRCQIVLCYHIITVVQGVPGWAVEATRRKCQVSSTRFQLVGESRWHDDRGRHSGSRRPQGVQHPGGFLWRADSPRTDLSEPRRVEEVPVPMAGAWHQCLLVYGNYRRCQRRLQQQMMWPSPSCVTLTVT